MFCECVGSPDYLVLQYQLIIIINNKIIIISQMIKTQILSVVTSTKMLFFLQTPQWQQRHGSSNDQTGGAMIATVERFTDNHYKGVGTRLKTHALNNCHTCQTSRCEHKTSTYLSFVVSLWLAVCLNVTNQSTFIIAITTLPCATDWVRYISSCLSCLCSLQWLCTNVWLIA